MFCPACGSEARTDVDDTQRYSSCYKRKRTCTECGTQWATREEIETIQYKNPATNRLEKVTPEQFKKVLDYHTGRKRHPDIDKD